MDAGFHHSQTGFLQADLFNGDDAHLFSVLIVLSIFLISWLLGKYYSKRLVTLNTKMKQVQDGQLSLEIPEEESDEIGELFRSFSYMTKELRKLMLEQYRLGKNVKSAELRALQAQINPHFLYNTLDLINWEAMDYNAPEIMELAQNLAQFYRISLNKGRQIVRVREELNHVRAYVRIENYHLIMPSGLRLMRRRAWRSCPASTSSFSPLWKMRLCTALPGCLTWWNAESVYPR